MTRIILCIHKMMWRHCPSAGNHMLLRVLPSVYPRQPDVIHRHLGKLTAVLSQLDSAEQQHLIRLLQMVAEQHPLVRFNCADENIKKEVRGIWYCLNVNTIEAAGLVCDRLIQFCLAGDNKEEQLITRVFPDGPTVASLFIVSHLTVQLLEIHSCSCRMPQKSPYVAGVNVKV